MEPRILLVDDEEAGLAALAMALPALGFSAQPARTGAEAVALFQADPAAFDAVLLDLTMPDLDGGAVCRMIRELRTDTPIIVMSAYPESDIWARFEGQNVARFVEKPLDLATLSEVLRSVCQPDAR